MDFTVVLLGVGQLQAILHAWAVLDTLKVVVPAADIRNHVEAHEPARNAGLSMIVNLQAILQRHNAAVKNENKRHGCRTMPAYLSLNSI